MGLIFDTSVLIRAERAGQDVLDLLDAVRRRTGEVDLKISAVSLMEMAHGIARARNEAMRYSRQQFLNDIRAEIVAYPVDDVIAIQAGLMDGQLKARGSAVGMADLLIGVTALHHGHSVMTSNLRHFELLPGLEVVEL